MLQSWGRKESDTTEQLYFIHDMYRLHIVEKNLKQNICVCVCVTNLDNILKSRDITLPAKVHLVKAMVFPMSSMDGRAGP